MTILKVFLFLIVLFSFSRRNGVDGACTNVNPSDVVFVVDSSGSICDTDPGYVYTRDKTCNNWKSIVSFIEGIVNGLTIGPTAVMVGLVIFQTNSKVAWTLDQFPDKASLLHAINNLAYIGGDTSTTAGLRTMRTQVFSQAGDRPNAANIAIVITDGNPTTEIGGLNNEEAMVHDAGITVVAVGITNQINENILRSLSSPPQQININYFISPDFASISSISNKLQIYTFCPSEAPQLGDTTLEPCKTTTAIADITFVVDASGSICDSDPTFSLSRDGTCNNWQQILNFLKDVVSALNIGPTGNKVAMVIFSTNAYVAWNLNRYSDTTSLVNAIDQLQYVHGGNTATADGLEKMRTEVFSQAGDRSDVVNMAIIITDGKPTIRAEDLSPEIARVQDSGIVMSAIGITNSIDEDTLQRLSSPPHQKDVNYFMSPDFNSINAIKRNFEDQVLCLTQKKDAPI